MKQDRITRWLRTTACLSLAILLASCAGQSSSIAPPNTALGASPEPNEDPAESEKSSRTPRVITSVEYTSKSWTFESRDGALHRGFQLTTPNYEIFTTKTTESFIDRLPLFYEASLANYTSALANLPLPDERLRTFLFKDRAQWMDKTREILPGQASTFRNLGRGGFTTRGTAVLFYIDYWRSQRHHDTLAIAAHEGWHQYTQSTFINSLPVWLEEGIAAYMEGFRVRRGLTIFSPADNSERRSALRDTKNNPQRYSLIPLDTLITKTPQAFLQSGKSNLLTYYAQVWALVRFLAEAEDGVYRDGLELVLQDAAFGRLVPRLRRAAADRGQTWRNSDSANNLGRLVVLEYFNEDFDVFERQYLEFVDEIITSGRRR